MITIDIESKSIEFEPHHIAFSSDLMRHVYTVSVCRGCIDLVEDSSTPPDNYRGRPGVHALCSVKGCGHRARFRVRIPVPAALAPAPQWV